MAMLTPACKRSLDRKQCSLDSILRLRSGKEAPGQADELYQVHESETLSNQGVGPLLPGRRRCLPVSTGRATRQAHPAEGQRGRWARTGRRSAVPTRRHLHLQSKHSGLRPFPAKGARSPHRPPSESCPKYALPSLIHMLALASFLLLPCLTTWASCRLDLSRCSSPLRLRGISPGSWRTSMERILRAECLLPMTCCPDRLVIAIL